MNQHNVKLSNSQLNKLKSGLKNGTEVTLKFSTNVFADSNDETNFPHKTDATDAAIQKKVFELGMTTLIISNEEMNDIMKLLNLLKDLFY